MKSLVLILATALSAFSFSSISADDEIKFVQFVIEQDISREEAQEIDEFMRTQPGVQISRMDIYSKKYLVLFNAHYNYDQSFFVETFEKYGVTIKCYRDGIQGVDQIIHQKMDCQ